MSKIVLFADAHVQTGAWSGRDIAGDAYASFTQIVDYAISVRATAVIAAGDIIDKIKNRAAEIVFIGQELKKLHRADIPFYYIQGQHENDTPPWLSLFPGTVHLHEKAIRIADVNVYGIDWRPRHKLSDAIAKVPERTDLVVCHQVWQEFMGDITEPEGSLRDIPYATTVFTGDYHHKRLETVLRADGSVLRVISPGSTCMQDINEPPVKWFYVYESGRYLPVKLNTRAFLDLNLLNSGDAIRSITAANIWCDQNTANGLPLVRITYRSDDSDLRQSVIDSLGTKAHLFWRAQFADDTDPQGATASDEDGLPTLTKFFTDAEQDAAALLSRLIDSDKSTRLAILQQWINEEFDAISSLTVE